jgi:hypothetical protein
VMILRILERCHGNGWKSDCRRPGCSVRHAVRQHRPLRDLHRLGTGQLRCRWPERRVLGQRRPMNSAPGASSAPAASALEETGRNGLHEPDEVARGCGRSPPKHSIAVMPLLPRLIVTSGGS